MDVKSILLGFLICAPMTGYELKKFFNISFSFFSGLSYGSIYPSLRKMEEEGLVTVRIEVKERTANRKVYSVTPRGREVFRSGLGAPFELERHRSAFLTQLFFFAHLSKEERLGKVRHYLASVSRMEKQLEASRPQIELYADPFQRLCFQFGKRFYRDLTANISDIAAALEGIDDDNRGEPSSTTGERSGPQTKATKGTKR
jgi:DNA-binding PadR family transcriptional regulator